MNLGVRSTLDLLFDRACGSSACDNGLKVTITQLALEDFSAGLARQRVVKDEVLRDLEARETRFKKCRDVGWRRLSPNSSSGMPNTAQSRTPGQLTRTFSISAG